MRVKIAAKPVNISIIQVYMPTTTASEEEVHTVYEQLEPLLHETCADDNVL